MGTFRRHTLLALVAIAALAGPFATLGPAQSEARGRPVFEVASIKPYKDAGVGPRNSHSTYGPQGVDFGGRSLAFIIAEAYHIPAGRIVGPGSLTKQALWGPLTQGYDIVAKADHAVPKEQLRRMLQALLADRFQLKVHWETKTGPVYTLVIAKNGPKMEESQAGGDLVMSRGSDGFVFRNAEIFRLTGYLSSYADRVVVDGTGLKGLYNFTVKLPEDVQNPPAKSEGPSPDSPTASRFAEALKPLGLQLNWGSAPVDYLVVDHVQPPSAN